MIQGCLEMPAEPFEYILKRRFYIKFKELLQLHKVEFSLQELLSFGAQAHYQGVLRETVSCLAIAVIQRHLSSQSYTAMGYFPVIEENSSTSGSITHPTKTWNKLCEESSGAISLWLHGFQLSNFSLHVVVVLASCPRSKLWS